MSDTRKIDTFSFEPSNEKPLDKVVSDSDKNVFPPKDDYVPAVNITPQKHRIVIESDGRMFREMPDGNRIEITDEATQKLIKDKLNNKSRGGTDRGE